MDRLRQDVPFRSPRPELSASPSSLSSEEKPMQSIEQEIFAIVKEKLAVNEVTRTTTLQELGADSLDVVEVLMEVESRLGVAIPDQEASNMKTIGEVIDYVEKHRK